MVERDRPIGRRFRSRESETRRPPPEGAAAGRESCFGDRIEIRSGVASGQVAGQLHEGDLAPGLGFVGAGGNLVADPGDLDEIDPVVGPGSGGAPRRMASSEISTASSPRPCRAGASTGRSAGADGRAWTDRRLEPRLPAMFAMSDMMLLPATLGGRRRWIGFGGLRFARRRASVRLPPAAGLHIVAMPCFP